MDVLARINKKLKEEIDRANSKKAQQTEPTVDTKPCRLCMKNDNLEVHHIFNSNLFGDISEKINLCTDIQIDAFDSKPKFICKKCLDTLEIAFGFREMCRKTNSELSLSDRQGKIAMEDGPGRQKSVENRESDDVVGSSNASETEDDDFSDLTLYHCTICNFTMHSAEELKRHVTDLNGSHRYKRKRMKIDGADVFYRQCPVCNESFTDAVSLRHHIDIEHNTPVDLTEQDNGESHYGS